MKFLGSRFDMVRLGAVRVARPAVYFMHRWVSLLNCKLLSPSVDVCSGMVGESAIGLAFNVAPFHSISQSVTTETSPQQTSAIAKTAGYSRWRWIVPLANPFSSKQLAGFQVRLTEFVC